MIQTSPMDCGGERIGFSVGGVFDWRNLGCGLGHRLESIA